MITDIGACLKALRVGKNMTQKQIADHFGIAPSTISSYENDVNPPPIDVLAKLVSFYGASVDSILGLDSNVDVLGNLSPEQQKAVSEVNRTLIQLLEC